VKGLTAEALEQAEVETGGAIPWDRAFALAHGDSGFDPANPTWLPKWNFLCQMKHARAALLFSVFDPGSKILRVRAPGGSEIAANPMTPEGRARIASFLADYMGEEARGQPVFHHIPGHVFGDQRTNVISLNNLASLRDYEAKAGARRHRRRFRANIWFSGAPAWAERDWVGRELQIGGAVLRVIKGTTRCPATEVNPETGERDANPVAELRSFYGHVELGVHAEVVNAGRFALGDAMELMDI
ncbi:MAG: MOSC domain-containing protein, partial [Candidatus Eremiobacteraeota bacterium]|nr:MOSC domain-containing protein [Candidatus Eremiobacteraeota bacterium]